LGAISFERAFRGVEHLTYIFTVYEGLCSNKFGVDISEDLAKVFGMPTSNDSNKESDTTTEQERMVEIVVENNEEIGGTQHFELIFPSTNDGGATTAGLEDGTIVLDGDSNMPLYNVSHTTNQTFLF
jgi:hypothetical protein